MPTAKELTDPHLTEYVPPPATGPGICRVCHGASGSYARCYSCSESRKGVSSIDLVVPVSLTRTDQEAQLHNVLRDYKYSPDPDVRAMHGLHIAAVLTRFLANHRHCIENAAGREFDTIAIVPSKQGRVGAHPLAQAINRSAPLRDLYVPLLEPGPGKIERNAPAVDGFVVTAAAQGKHVLLIDDTMTTGAKLQSAAHALTVGGADVVAAVVLGRVIDVSDPREDASESAKAAIKAKQELWARQSAIPFDFATCCLE